MRGHYSYVEVGGEGVIISYGEVGGEGSLFLWGGGW